MRSPEALIKLYCLLCFKKDIFYYIMKVAYCFNIRLMSHKVISKYISRFAAVQFAYQLELTNANPLEAMGKFLSLDTLKEKDYKDIKINFFKQLVLKLNDSKTLDEQIEKSLKSGKTLKHLSVMELCILRVALIEMIYEKTDLPVIINEYVEIAKTFLDNSSIKFINALLDNISKNIERKCLTKI